MLSGCLSVQLFGLLSDPLLKVERFCGLLQTTTKPFKPFSPLSGWLGATNQSGREQESSLIQPKAMNIPS